MKALKLIAGILATVLGGIGLGLLFLALTPKYLFAPMIKRALSK